MCRKLLLLIAGLAAGLCRADTEPMYRVDEDLKYMAQSIVDDYHARRAECVRSDGEARQACYYRLRISQWDYQEAKKILIDQREQKRVNAYAVQ